MCEISNKYSEVVSFMNQAGIPCSAGAGTANSFDRDEPQTARRARLVIESFHCCIASMEKRL